MKHNIASMSNANIGKAFNAIVNVKLLKYIQKTTENKAWTRQILVVGVGNFTGGSGENRIEDDSSVNLI